MDKKPQLKETQNSEKSSSEEDHLNIVRDACQTIEGILKNFTYIVETNGEKILECCFRKNPEAKVKDDELKANGASIKERLNAYTPRKN